MAVSVLELFVGFGVGIFSALFGVGGGLLIIPFLVLALGFDQHAAEGTSLLVIVPTAAAGVLAHLRRGYVAPREAVLLAGGGIGGALAGAEVALRISAATLESAFGIVVAAVGLRLVASGWKERGG